MSKKNGSDVYTARCRSRLATNTRCVGGLKSDFSVSARPLPIEQRHDNRVGFEQVLMSSLTRSQKAPAGTYRHVCHEAHARALLLWLEKPDDQPGPPDLN